VHEEDRLFEELVERDQRRLKWSDLGKYLFIESNRKFFRTPKQCRERWLNHLDPSKLKKFWLEEEDFTLIEYVKLHGKKWAAISKKLDSKRNEHSIKNRYKSLLTRESKLTMKPFNEDALVDAIYLKFQHAAKREQGKEDSSRRPEPDMSDDYDSSYDSVSIFEEKEGDREVHDILNNISLNTVKHSHSEDSEDKSRADRQAFEFSKSAQAEGAEGQGREWRKEERESEVEKRIRADLFLQEDPFEMLKSYFYKGG
jgi:hypothetical protein